MKNVINLWLYVSIVLLATSCGPQRQIKKCEKCILAYSDTTRIIKDSTVILFDTLTHILEVPADTSIQVIVIECDSTGKASIKSSTTTNGSRSTINTTLNNNTLNIQATCKEYIDSLQIVNKEVNRLRSETNTVFVPQLIEKKLTWWQRFKINWGGYAFLIIGLAIGFKAISFWAKSNNPLVWLSRLRK